MEQILLLPSPRRGTITHELFYVRLLPDSIPIACGLRTPIVEMESGRVVALSALSHRTLKISIEDVDDVVKDPAEKEQLLKELHAEVLRRQ